MNTAATLAPNQLQTVSTRDQLILEHMSLVRSIASYVQRSMPVHVELDDLAHAGMLGLIDAAEKFQAGKEVAFASYAKHRIRGAILDSLRRSDWVSRDTRKRYKQVESTRQALAAKLHREPTEQEIASELNIDATRWQDMMIDFGTLQAASARKRVENEDERPVQDIPSSAAESPENLFARSEMGKRLTLAMGTLPERYRQVLTGYYHRDLTMREIADELGIRESRVSQIHKTALALMQNSLVQSGISRTAALAA